MNAAREISEDTDPSTADPFTAETPTMESWADSFHFSDDLKALEEFYYQQHQETLTEEARTYHPAERQEALSETPDEDVSPEDAQFLKRLSEQISQRLGEHLSNPEVLAQYLHLNELERDNRIMAEQIQALKQTLHAREIEHQARLEEASQYKQLVGKLYYKTH
jgi:hypothetical protein